MLVSYHNHSTWSDGLSAPQEMADRAGEIGVDEVGVSDHFILLPGGGTYPWSVPPQRLHAYVEEIEALKAKRPAVRLGLEVDWIAGQAEAIAGALDDLPFDFLIGSVHETSGFIVDADPARWDGLSRAEQEYVHRSYWREVREMAASGLFDVVGHLELTRKFGHRPVSDLGELVTAALDQIAASGMAVELNTAGWYWPCREPYPSVKVLRWCREREIAVVVSADAHHADHLVRGFGPASRLLAEVGYTEVVRFKNRSRIASVPLPREHPPEKPLLGGTRR